MNRSSSWRHRRRGPVRVAAACLIATIVALTAGAPAGSTGTANSTGTAGANQPADPPTSSVLRLASVSPWVDPDGTWTASFDLIGTVPLDATLTISVRRPVEGSEPAVRSRLARARADEELPSPLQSDIERTMAGVLTPTSLEVELPIRARSGDQSRVLVPNPGVHPVVIEVAAGDGTLLHREVLFLNRLPAEVEGNPLQLDLLLGIHTDTTVSADSTWSVPDAGRREVDRAVQLLDAHPSVPVTMQPDPDLIEALAASPEPADRARLQRLSALLGARETLRSPWASLDIESWSATGRLADLQYAMALGQQTLFVTGKSEPSGLSWADDPTLGPQALPRLAEVGVERVVVDPSQLVPEDSLEDDPGTTRSFVVEGDGQRLDGAALDPVVAQLLAATDQPPAAAAHDAITELQAIWFASEEATPGTVVAIDQRVSEANASAFLDVLGPDRTPLVEPTTLDSWFERTSPYERTVSRRTETLVREVVAPADVVDVAPLSTYLGVLRARADAYHSTMSDTPGLVPLDQLLASSLGRDLGEPGQRARLDATAGRIDTDLAAITAPPRRNFTVTSRRATLPLQFGNALDRPVLVQVRFIGTRLEIEGGQSRLLELQPGLTKVDLPVVARTSGQFEIGVQMRTADGDVVISRTDIRVRSTAFSGVGLLLGGGAVAFLALWWIRTLRRGRKADETPPDPPGADPSLA
jgi:hypothetical protein